MAPIMKLSLSVVVLAFSIASVGHADPDRKMCHVGTLRGSYVFTANGYNIVNGVSQPKAIVELIDFDGNGGLSVPGATRSVNGVITRTPPGGTGTYEFIESCAGDLQFGPGGPTYDFFTSPAADTIWMIQTNTNTVFEGTAEKVRQKSD
jgi:hypothetical protein